MRVTQDDRLSGLFIVCFLVRCCVSGGEWCLVIIYLSGWVVAAVSVGGNYRQSWCRGELMRRIHDHETNHSTNSKIIFIIQKTIYITVHRIQKMIDTLKVLKIFVNHRLPPSQFVPVLGCIYLSCELYYSTYLLSSHQSILTISYLV